MMETMKPVHSRGGWQEGEIQLLFQAVKAAGETGQPLRDVFAGVAQELKRKPNSIRNFYYARLRELPDMNARKAPFRTFSQEEIHTLLRTVLIARGNGESVRACVTRMGEGDRGRMLRYQNKYRSILKNRPDMLEEIAAQLREEGLPCPTQVTGYRRTAGAQEGTTNALEEATRLSGELEDESLAQMMAGLCTLYRRLRDAENRAQAAQEAGVETVSVRSAKTSGADLEITLTDLREGCPDSVEAQGEDEYYVRWMEVRREADRLRVQVDLLKLHLEDLEKRHHMEMNLIRGTVHEFLSLPENSRVKELEDFVGRATEALHMLDMAGEIG